ncbi:hypothetical protein GCM10009678_07430 [Actinomadura kijaniata]|uniref:DNA recombination-mediator protein A n=1 Tax=Actinomadura namibiensis TaxID=182080 RepID=A0A7W3QKD2_ACTNM|nr:hypothetical protein [Actinomadura namibiensis]MBA8950290.1 hypothetical protein [Actinomadura namibiensis]
MPTTVTITGTRSTGHRPLTDYREIFEEFVRPFARSSDVRFYLGGAAGIDSLALLWLAGETDVALTVAVPAKLGDQPADARRAIATARETGRVELVELGGETRTSGYHSRNRWMVDRSKFVIGFPRAGTTTSGTYYTLDYGAQQGKPRLVVPI